MSIQDRLLGGLYGSLVGDALGVPVEFSSREKRMADPVTGMRAFGTWNQPAGSWSDDGALLLCAVESWVEKGFDTQDMGERFVRWQQQGHWTARGNVFDIGNATASALYRIHRGTPAEQAGGKEEHDNGNGSLMRILPVSIAVAGDDEEVMAEKLARASAITHGHERSKMACVFHGLMVRGLLAGVDPLEALKQAQEAFATRFQQHPEFGVFSQVMNQKVADLPESEIGSSGYVLDTLTASIWCLLTTESFSECVLKAVNLGGDTDTTGCVAGGLAGLVYGHQAIPTDWTAALPRAAELSELLNLMTDQL